MKEMNQKFIERIGEYRIFEVIRDDYIPENVGMIIFYTPEGNEYFCNTVEEAEFIINKMMTN